MLWFHGSKLGSAVVLSIGEGRTQFLSHRRAKHQATNSKLQRSSKSQNTKPQKQMPGQTARRSVFELGVWCFFGAWSLEFGACCLDSPVSQKLRSAQRQLASLH